MSWISGIESMLNSIDQAAASTLQTDRKRDRPDAPGDEETEAAASSSTLSSSLSLPTQKPSPARSTGKHSIADGFVSSSSGGSTAGSRSEEPSRELQARLSRMETEKAVLLKEQLDLAASHAEALRAMQTDLAHERARREDETRVLEAQRRTADDHRARLQVERDQLASTLADMERRFAEQQEIVADAKASRHEADALRRELEEYKARAARILQAKEKLIAELRVAPVGASTQDTAADLALRTHERDEARAEAAQAATALEQLREDMAALEQQQQADMDLLEVRIRTAEASLAAEQRAHAATRAERDATVRELRTQCDDAQRAATVAAQATKEREREAAQLHDQLLRRPASSDAQLEARVRELTDMVVAKQAQMEALTAQKSSLALQLETEQRRREETRVTVPLNLGTPVAPRDTAPRARGAVFIDDGTPHARITRRVKEAASAVDAFSIRLGVFLRRYPPARAMVLAYMMLLHIWVLVVLLTYTPEMHAADDMHHP